MIKRIKKDNSNWQKLFCLALPILKDLPQNYTWALGGGTAMAIQTNGRKHKVLMILVKMN